MIVYVYIGMWVLWCNIMLWYCVVWYGMVWYIYICVCVVRYSITSCYLLWFVFTVCEVNFAIYTYWVDSFWIIVLSWCIVSQHIVCVVSYVLMLYFVTFYFTKLHVFIQYIAFSFHALYMVLIIFQYFIDWLIQYIAMHLVVMCYCRRKFRSQTSDNMDRWKAELGRAPLWREAHFQVKSVQKLTGSDHFWKLRCRKSARRCGAKHISKSKCTKHTTRTTFGSWDVEKVHAVVARSTFRSQNVKTDMFGPLLDVQMSFRVAGARDCAPCQKWAKREGFVAFPKTMAGVGHLKRICKDAFSVAGAVQETCSSELLGGPGADFLRRVAFWSIRSSGLLRWFCVTGAALRMTWHHFFVAGAVL